MGDLHCPQTSLSLVIRGTVDHNYIHNVLISCMAKTQNEISNIRDIYQ